MEKTMLDYFIEAADRMGYEPNDVDRFFFDRHVQEFFEDYIGWCKERQEKAFYHGGRYTFIDRLYVAAKRVGYELTDEDIQEFNNEQADTVFDRAVSENMDCEEYMKYYELDDYMYDYVENSKLALFDDYCDTFISECISMADLECDDDGMVIYS